MGITCKMNGGKNLKGIYSQKIFSMGITCKLNWENLHVISSQKKIIWESLVKWTQIKFKGKSNERKREISKKEKKIEERKEKKRLASLASLARAVLGKAIQLFQYAAVQTLAAGFQALCANFIVTDGWWWWMVDGGGGWWMVVVVVEKKVLEFR